MRRLICAVLICIFLGGCMSTKQTITTETVNQNITGTPTSQAPDLTTVPASGEAETEPPTTETIDPIAQIMNAMHIEEKVGQLFLARCPDVGALEDIKNYHLGGYILFARDFEGETPETIQSTIQGFQTASAIPMLIAVDEEGGIVNRISRYAAFRDTPFLSSRTLYNTGGMDLIHQNEVEKCQLLKALGINVNVSPVCDVTTDPNAFMYPRSLGQSPEITGEFVKTTVSVMEEHCIGGVLKHFPGYGNNTDTHVAIAVDDRPLAQLESVDLVPFAAGIDAGAQAIMVSHVYICALDDQTPATLSPVVHEYLRSSMGFDGVIITDDLVMQAITDVYGVGESAILAVLAGNDLLCVTDYSEQYTAVLQAVVEGRISSELLDAAVYRVLRWKAQLHLL